MAQKRKSISEALWHWNNLLNLQCTLNVRLKVLKRGGWGVLLLLMIGVKGPQMLIWQQTKETPILKYEASSPRRDFKNRT